MASARDNHEVPVGPFLPSLRSVWEEREFNWGLIPTFAGSSASWCRSRWSRANAAGFWRGSLRCRWRVRPVEMASLFLLAGVGLEPEARFDLFISSPELEAVHARFDWTRAQLVDQHPFLAHPAERQPLAQQ